MEYRGVFDTLVGSSLRFYNIHICDNNNKFFLFLGFLHFFQFLKQSKHQPRVDTYWLLEKEGNDVANWDVGSPEDNKTNMIPDYVKELIFPSTETKEGGLDREMQSVDSGQYI